MAATARSVQGKVISGSAAGSAAAALFTSLLTSAIAEAAGVIPAGISGMQCKDPAVCLGLFTSPLQQATRRLLALSC